MLSAEKRKALTVSLEDRFRPGEAAAAGKQGERGNGLYHPNRYFNRRPPKKAIEMLVKVPIK